MHTNVYLTVEFRGPGSNAWAFFARLPDVGVAPTLSSLLQAPPDAAPGLIDELSARGLPEDAADESLREDSYVVDDDAARSGVGDALDEVRFCTSEEANAWVASGRSVFVNRGRMVSDPLAYGHSWLNFQEFQRLVAVARERQDPRGFEAACVEQVAALAAAMAQLESRGYSTRVVYWFDG